MFTIDLMSRKPIYEQLQSQTEKLILTGILHPLDKMPSVRGLSAKLSVNPNTIQRAYTDMCNQGILTSMMGKGYYVTENAVKVIQRGALKKFDELDILIEELKMANVDEETIVQHIRELFGEEEKKND